MKLRVTKDTDNKQPGGTQDQAPLGGSQGQWCCPSWDGGFVGFEAILTKIQLSCPGARALCPFKHKQSQQLCTLPADRHPQPSPAAGGQGQQEESSGILGFRVVLAVLEAPRKATQCLKSTPGSAGSLRKGYWAKEERLAHIPRGSLSQQPGLHCLHSLLVPCFCRGPQLSWVGKGPEISSLSS